MLNFQIFIIYWNIVRYIIDVCDTWHFQQRWTHFLWYSFRCWLMKPNSALDWIAFGANFWNDMQNINIFGSILHWVILDFLNTNQRHKTNSTDRSAQFNVDITAQVRAWSKEWPVADSEKLQLSDTNDHSLWLSYVWQKVDKRWFLNS